jgi:iron complex outermembrane receptor protein
MEATNVTLEKWFAIGSTALVIAIGASWAQTDSDTDAEPDSTYSEEMTVTTASRTEQQLHEVPAAVTVITPEQIEQTPADDYGDLLRTVPGLSVSQISARDVNVTGRGATNSLSTYQLVLMDNRSIYLDFFGFVMWDLLPLDTKEVKQIEAVRGPGSAVWGANALGGVVNIITKSPREMQGGSVTLGTGDYGTRYANVSYADAKGRLGWKVSGSYYEQDPYDRPTGRVPVGGAPYPDIANGGTEQPKLNARLDFDQTEDTQWSFQFGTAKTDGLIHTGIGPFDIDKGTKFDFVHASFKHKTWRAQFFVNRIDGNATNLLSIDSTGNLIDFDFVTDTYSLDVSNTNVVGKRHILTYGATARKNNFDLSLAPLGEDRQEFGVFFQDDILLTDSLRWLIGGRYDDVDPIDGVFSPRTSLLWQIEPRKHSLRVSYNRAFRAPSVVNNYLDVVISTPVNLTAVGGPSLYLLPSAAVGDPELKEETLEAYEIGYTGTYRNATVTFAAFRNILEDSTDFFLRDIYTSADPPENWPIPAFIIDLLPQELPKTFSYRNIGKTTQDGLEASFALYPKQGWSFGANYTWLDDPEFEGFNIETTADGGRHVAANIPPTHRASLNVGNSGKVFHWNVVVDHQGKAFWTDILDTRFWGPTEKFTQYNVGLSWHLFDGNATLGINGQNLTDERVQHHVFGDILGRKVSAQVTFRF